MEENKDAIIRQQQLIMRDQQDTINRLNCELAPHRQWDRFAKREPWRFALFLLLRDVWPFKVWYSRFD